MPMFEPGQRVLRREDRELRGAVVMAADSGPDGPVYRIAHDEGGEGWWPESALEPEPG